MYFYIDNLSHEDLKEFAKTLYAENCELRRRCEVFKDTLEESYKAYYSEDNEYIN